MAQAFTPEQLSLIREKLLESARRHALQTGVRKTSLDTLTAEAGIAKSTFYKFYESKEKLFMEVAAQWEAQILSRAAQTLRSREGMSNKARAARFVLAAFEGVHSLGLVRFMREDLPYLTSLISPDEARSRYMSSARTIFHALKEADIRFAAPEETVLSAIQMMYLSILNIRDLGEGFFPALRMMVEGACDRLVA